MNSKIAFFRTLLSILLAFGAPTIWGQEPVVVSIGPLTRCQTADQMSRRVLAEVERLNVKIASLTALKPTTQGDSHQIDFKQWQVLVEDLVAKRPPWWQGYVTSLDYLNQDCPDVAILTRQALSQWFEAQQNCLKAEAHWLRVQSSDKSEPAVASHPKESVIDRNTIDDKLAQSRIEKIAIEQDKQQAEIELRSAENKVEVDFAKAKVAIEAYRKRLAEKSQLWIEDLKKVMDKYQKIATETDALMEQLNQSTARQDGNALMLYGRVKETWQILLDDGLLVYDFVFQDTGMPVAPVLDPQLAAKVAPTKRETYEASYQKAIEEYQALELTRHQTLDANIDQYFSIVAKVSKARAELLANIDFMTLTENAGAEYIDDLSREIFAIPLRIWGASFSRYSEVKRDLHNGLIGILSLLKKSILLALLFLMPWFSRKIAAFTGGLIDRQRKKLLARRLASDRLNLKLAFWLQRLTPYVPFLLYIFCLQLTELILVDTVYRDLMALIPLLEYFLGYRLFRLIVRDTLGSLRNITQIDSKDPANLIDRTTKIIGRFFLVSFSVMHITELAVDQGLMYGLIEILMWVVGLAVWFYAFSAWRDIIVPAVQQNIKGKWGQRIAKYCQGHWGLLLCLPCLLAVLVVAGGQASWAWVSEWESTKKFLTRIYRRKIESMGAGVAQAEVSDLPATYLDLFSYQAQVEGELMVDSHSGALAVIKREVDAWLREDEEDHSLVIVGEKGIGKSTLLSRIEKSYPNLQTVHIEIGAKIAKKQGLTDLMARALGAEDQENLTKMILEYNRDATKPVLILLDDAHNLFIGKVGGFEALKALVEIVNLNTRQIFWCLTFNTYSWSYLRGILGNSDYFRKEIILRPWTDGEVRDLIFNRHRASGFQLSFDRIIMATQSSSSFLEAKEIAREQFFRLLWEQSSGNPRVALYLWLQSLKLVGQNHLKVGLPERPRAEKLTGLSDSMLFVLSAIASHENGTRKEISDATNLGLNAVSHAIKVGLESRFIHRSPGNRYRLSFAYQHDLLKQLKAKNFIYGID